MMNCTLRLDRNLWTFQILQLFFSISNSILGDTTKSVVGGTAAAATTDSSESRRTYSYSSPPRLKSSRSTTLARLYYSSSSYSCSCCCYTTWKGSFNSTRHFNHRDAARSSLKRRNKETVRELSPAFGFERLWGFLNVDANTSMVLEEFFWWFTQK